MGTSAVSEPLNSFIIVIYEGHPIKNETFSIAQ